MALRPALPVMTLAALVLAAWTASAGWSAPAAKGKYQCSGKQKTVFDNTNGLEVDDGATPPTFSTHGKAYCVTYIQTYHWNSGNGAAPGTLGLRRVSVAAALPRELGPFQAKGSSGQGGAANVNWYADVPTTTPEIIDGIYECQDSGESTWSSNKASAAPLGGNGFCIVYGVPARYVIAHS